MTIEDFVGITVAGFVLGLIGFVAGRLVEDDGFDTVSMGLIVVGVLMVIFGLLATAVSAAVRAGRRD